MRIVSIANGQRLLIRPIRPDDKAELQRGVRRLSQRTVHQRFLMAKPRFTSSELRYLTEVDGVNHIALAAVELEFPHHIVAVARAVRLPDQPDTAEWAIVVADPLQGMRLGSRLVEALAVAVRAVGITRFSATMLGDNVPVQRLLLRMATRLERDERHDGLREVVGLLAA
jgi:GNAT superfamily N-acetyltransferase